MYKEEKKRRRKRRWPAVLGVLALLAVILSIVYYLLDYYRIEDVYVDGNVHYTKEEIMDIVMEGPLGNNSLYLSFKYKEKSVTGVPFVAAMDVTILTPNAIRVSVYEKSMAGYIEYLGRYIYFDRDGTVVESSNVRTLGIPEVTGLKFDHVVMGEPLPVANIDVFNRIFTVTQALAKKEPLIAERIYFDAKENMTIYLGDIVVQFGDDTNLDDKVIFLKSLMPKLDGMKGTLDIQNYGANVKTYSFTPDT